MKARALRTGEMVPEMGDRVPYIMLADAANNKAKACELSEDPLYALKTGAPIDTNYYIRKQILPALLRVFTGIWEPERCREIESDLFEKDAELSTFKAYKRLFAKDLKHMRCKVIPRVRPQKEGENSKEKQTGNFGIARWVQPLPSCLGCGVSVARKTDVVCKYCNYDAVRAQKEKMLSERLEAHKKAWKTCRDCQGGSFGTVTCSNVTCHNFFHRERVITDLEDIQQEMKRFVF